MSGGGFTGLGDSQWGDGINALKMLEQHSNVDLLLLDIFMPRLDGFGVLASMRFRSLLFPRRKVLNLFRRPTNWVSQTIFAVPLT